MRMVAIVFSLASLLLMSVSMTVHAEQFYACSDGRTVLLTNKAELGCPVYEPRAKLATVPDGATTPDAEWAAATQNPEGFQPRPERQVKSMTRNDLCQNPWPDLSMRPRGEIEEVEEMDAQTEYDVWYWEHLSGLLSFIRVPCESYAYVYPRIR